MRALWTALEVSRQQGIEMAKLFTRTGSGLAFTPGGLRLASRAVEILGLQDRTAREVSQATRDEICGQFPEEQVVEIVGTIAAYNMVSRFLVALGINADGENA